ncbi:MAG: hypothetical protein VZR09_02705 [Candidatus Gastranaerophilaceae bacterium]|nr:hypothetical protein [Candidatus Gastranaerophilaceae bacterium]
MEIRFADENFDIKNLTKSELSGVNQFLLENNKKQLESILNFYNSKTPMLLVNGFLGSGKTQIVNHSLKFLSQETIVLEYNCFETTILDDILLSFFEDFKELALRDEVSHPKIKSENFTQKITAYFNSINRPILIIINSLESVLKNNKQEILDFLFHVSGFYNIKTILISRKFDYDDFTDKIPYEKVTILAFEKSIFEKYLRAKGIKMIGPVSDELYKHTRGYYLYTELTVKIINAHKLSLIDFIDGYTKSFLTYNDFIFREALSFVDPANGHLFRLLSIIRHPISTKLLETINLYNEEKIEFFVNNLLLNREKNMIYLQDYYKEISQNSIPENVLAKLHKACVELYTTQLPLKPFERDLLISRQTMRTEIEYHTMFLPKKPMLVRQMEAAAIEAIEYAADLKTNYDDIPTAEGLPIQPDIEIEKTETKEEKLKKISFIFDNEDEERDIMDGIAASINKYIDYSNKILTPEEMRLPFMELMNAANREEKNFNYQKALAFYQLALTMKEDDNFPLMVSRIYVKTAKCYEKLSDWFNAVKYYEIALEYFVNSGDKEKFNEMRLAVANIFYNTYKHDKAEKLLLDILNPNEDISNELKIKARLLLASVNNKDLKEVYNNYKSAFTLADNTVNRKVLAELYFKFAAVCDELDETETAIKLYKRCTDIPDNSYLSSAMTNLAMIYDDTGSTDLAVKYYLESLNIDEKNKNLSGVYESAIRLAKYYKRKEPEKSLDLYRKAMNAAKELGEPYYLMNINVEYGDFCADKREFSKALKAYIKAYARAKNNSMSEYKTKIEQRLRDLKLRLGDEAFKKLELEVTQNG